MTELIKNFTPRIYQQTILAGCIEKNTLVVLPTGLGKTAIALMLAVHRLNNFPTSKILFLAPTKPLVQQHYQTFRNHLNLEDNYLNMFTGEVNPEKRAGLWKSSKIIFSTPQGLENDILSGKINLEEVSLIIFDEAHRAVGNYHYNFVAQQYEKKSRFFKILGLTASPGSNLEKILEVCRNLFIDDVEVRTENDYDVRPYVQNVNIIWQEVDFPEELKKIKQFLEIFVNEKLKLLKVMGIIKKEQFNFSKKELIEIQRSIHSAIASGENDAEHYRAVSVFAEIMKVYHAIEIIETQGVTTLYKYMEQIFSDASNSKVKAVQNLVRDENFKSAFFLCNKLYEAGVEHPKFAELKKIIVEELASRQDSKIIIFNNFRDNVVKVFEEISKIQGVMPVIFVGQAKKGETGISQKKQKEIIEKFSAGEFNVLISTSVGEEGLDIPRVDLVVFYEPIPSAIRHIQRKGRTGRLEKGKVIILIAKNTRDVSYKWSAFNKEKRMYGILRDLKKKIIMNPVARTKKDDAKNVQKKLSEIPKEDSVKILKIFADTREKGNGVIKELIEQNVNVSVQMLDAGDYLLSERVGVEYKTIPDFVDSIIDGRLLSQAVKLKENFEKPLVIVEGEEDIFSQRNIHPHAVKGAILTLAVDFGIPVIFTKNSRDTASYMILTSKREKERGSRDYSPHSNKKQRTTRECQEYIVSALPGVGPALAKPLLNHFKSVKNVINATEEDMRKVEKMGPKKAKEIRNVLDSEYEF